MKGASIDMDAMLARLHLRNTRRVWKDICARAEKESWTYQHLLECLVSEEIAQRATTRVGREVRRAGFPYFKTIDDFDFTLQASLRLSMIGTYLSPDFVTDGRNVVLLGKPGRGKTHLAIAIAYRAIQNGFAARFTTAAELIDALSRASQAGDLRAALTDWVYPNVLVIDEMGYLAYGNDAANLLFHVVNERHLKRRPMIFTTNKGLKSWGRVLHDQDLGDAIVDRVLERGAVLKLDGPSVRSRHVDPQDLEGPDPVGSEPAIISGMGRPSFPEPTDVVPDSPLPVYRDDPASRRLNQSRGERHGADASGKGSFGIKLFRIGAKEFVVHEGLVYPEHARRAPVERTDRPGQQLKLKSEMEAVVGIRRAHLVDGRAHSRPVRSHGQFHGTDERTFRRHLRAALCLNEPADDADVSLNARPHWATLGPWCHLPKRD